MTSISGRFAVLLYACATAVTAQEPSASAPPKTLSTVRVQDDVAPASETSLGKTAKSVREIPQSVSILTRERLEQQSITSLPEAMKYTTGITVQRFDGAGLYNTFNARGYAADSFMLDGLNVRTNSNMADLDLAPFERIEVLRGAAGLFQGTGQPGVTLNFIRKRAQAPARVQTSLGAGSWYSYRGELDATSALTQSGRVRGRIVTVYDDRGSHLDGVDSRKKLGYGTLELDVTERSTLSVGAIYQDVQAVTDQGLPAYADGQLLDVPRSTAIIADWNLQDAQTQDGFAEWVTDFDDGKTLKVSLRRHDRDSYYRSARANRLISTDGAVNIQYVENFSDQKDLVTDVYFSTPLELFGRSHTWLIGADYREGKTFSRHGDGPSTVSNVFSHNRHIPMPVFVDAVAQRTRSKTEEYGTYTQLQLRPAEPLSLILGGRLSWWDSVDRSAVTGAVTSRGDEKAEITPYLGVVFDLNAALSLYASYTDIFKPQLERTSAGEQLKPRAGVQYEAGLKGEFHGGALTTHLAVYRLTDQNRAISDPENADFSIAVGKVRSKGAEAEISGVLTDNWSLTAGYAYVRTKYVKAAVTEQGQSFSTFTPKHTFNVWTHYVIADGALAGLELGAGVRAVSEFYAVSGDVRFVGDEYAVASTQVGYTFLENHKVALNVDNLFDKKYYEKVSGASRQNYYGAPRSFMVTLRSQF